MRYLVVVLIALVFAPSASADGWPAVNELASKVVGKTVEIRCVTREQWERDPLRSGAESAYAIPEWGYAVLPPDACGPLVLLLADPNERTSVKGYINAEGIALLTFLHETMHLAGFASEGEAECRAYRMFRPTALALGVRAKRADALLRIARVAHQSKPPAYRSVC